MSTEQVKLNYFNSNIHLKLRFLDIKIQTSTKTKNCFVPYWRARVHFQLKLYGVQKSGWTHGLFLRDWRLNIQRLAK